VKVNKGQETKNGKTIEEKKDGTWEGQKEIKNMNIKE
jgi:hypothetical protein